MSRGLHVLQAHDLAEELERELLPRLVGLLQARAAGHCMRIADLDRGLMLRLCARLRAEVPDSQVVVLGNGRAGKAASFEVSSTKLVELRNPLPDGSLRSPLLVFVPSDVRAAAEDSFGVATFEEIPVGDVYESLRRRLLGELPSTVRGAVATVGFRPVPASELRAVDPRGESFVNVNTPRELSALPDLDDGAHERE